MLYQYCWQEVSVKDSSSINEFANAYLLLRSDSGEVILEEQYVPLGELVDLMGAWDMIDRFEYSPEGYEQNPLISLQISQDNIEIDTPDTRSKGTIVKLTKREFSEFYNSFSRQVKNDIDDLLSG